MAFSYALVQACVIMPLPKEQAAVTELRTCLFTFFFARLFFRMCQTLILPDIICHILDDNSRRHDPSECRVLCHSSQILVIWLAIAPDSGAALQDSVVSLAHYMCGA